MNVKDAICERNERVVEKLFKSLSGKFPDFDTVASLFAEDSYYWALTPVTPQRRGPQEIVDDLKKQLAIGGDLESGPAYALVSSNNHVVLERTDYVTVAMNQRRAGVRICSVFEFDAAGKIKAWREYWDKSYCAEQMGFTSEQVRDAIT
jgi:limonene-1,2-epoxide hydrolase